MIYSKLNAKCRHFMFSNNARKFYWNKNITLDLQKCNKCKLLVDYSREIHLNDPVSKGKLKRWAFADIHKARKTLQLICLVSDAFSILNLFVSNAGYQYQRKLLVGWSFFLFISSPDVSDGRYRTCLILFRLYRSSKFFDNSDKFFCPRLSEFDVKFNDVSRFLIIN